MRRTILTALSAALAIVLCMGMSVGACAAAGPASRQAKPSASHGAAGKGEPVRVGSRYAPGKVLVKFRQGAGAAEVESLAGGRSAAAVRKLTAGGLVEMNIGGRDVPRTVDALRA